MPSPGSASLFSWTTTNAVSFEVNQGVGVLTPTASGTMSIAVVRSLTFTGTATSASGATASCSVPIDISPGGGGGGGGGGCTSNCGGGGGGGGIFLPPAVTVFSHPSTQPLSFLYLSQIPYTGLDLGPWGTALYWLALVVWSGALAYVALFTAPKYLKRRLNGVGARVGELINGTIYAPEYAPEYSPVQAEHSYSYEDTSYEPATPTLAAPAYDRASFEGFKSFAGDKGLTVDDIVKGLSRYEHDIREPRAPEAPAPRVLAARVAAASVPHAVTPAEQTRAPERKTSSPETTSIPPHIRGFIASILEGDRAAVFGALRQHTRDGGEAERLLTRAVCALDDAYRARIDGTACDPEIARVCANCDTPLLERTISALTIAIDSSYSHSITGAKLALTRALATLGA